MHIESVVMLVLGIISIIVVSTLISEFFMSVRNLYDNHKYRKMQNEYYDKYDDPFYTEEDK
mgnify:FL=1